MQGANSATAQNTNRIIQQTNPSFGCMKCVKKGMIMLKLLHQSHYGHHGNNTLTFHFLTANLVKERETKTAMPDHEHS